MISYDNIYWFFNLFVVENKYFVFWPFPQIFAFIDSIAASIGCPNGFFFILIFN